MLGIGGAAAYIWKQTFSDLSSNHDQLSSNNFFHWLFSEERLRGEGFQGGKRDGARETCCSDLSVGGDRSHSCLGLNILTGDNQNRKEHFLKHLMYYQSTIWRRSASDSPWDGEVSKVDG